MRSGLWYPRQTAYASSAAVSTPSVCQRTRVTRLRVGRGRVEPATVFTREDYARAGLSGNMLSIALELCSACSDGNCGGVCDVRPRSRIIAMMELKSAAV